MGFTFLLFKPIFTLSLRLNKLELEGLSPINSKYSELLDGLPTVRAYDKMQYIFDNFWNKMNIFSLTAVIRHIVEGRMKLLIYGVANSLAIISILNLLFLDQSFKNYTIFVIFNYFAIEDTVIKFYQSFAAFAPRLESLGKC